MLGRSVRVVVRLRARGGFPGARGLELGTQALVQALVVLAQHLDHGSLVAARLAAGRERERAHHDLVRFRPLLGLGVRAVHEERGEARVHALGQRGPRLLHAHAPHDAGRVQVGPGHGARGELEGDHANAVDVSWRLAVAPVHGHEILRRRPCYRAERAHAARRLRQRRVHDLGEAEVGH